MAEREHLQSVGRQDLHSCEDRSVWRGIQRGCAQRGIPETRRGYQAQISESAQEAAESGREEEIQQQEETLNHDPPMVYLYRRWFFFHFDKGKVDPVRSI